MAGMNSATPTAPAQAAPDPLAGFRPDAVRLGVFLLALAVGALLYVRWGCDSDVVHEGHSIFAWVAMHWRLAPDFRINWAVLAVAAIAAWREREALAAAAVRPSWLGTVVVGVALLVHVVGYRSQLPRLSIASVPVALWGLSLAVWGPRVARILAFPCAYVLLAFTNSLLVELTMPLRLMASRLAVLLLQGVGIGASNNGTVVFAAAGGGFQFDVEEGCSGLRSLVTMTALAAPYAYFTMSTNVRRLALFALSVPLAMLANALRIFSLGVVAEGIGMRLAMSLYHDFSGYLVFFLSLLLLIGAGSILNQDWRARLCALKPRRRSAA